MITPTSPVSAKFSSSPIKVPPSLSLLASSLLLLGFQHHAAAETFTWVNAKISTWDDTTSWSGGVAPTSDLDNIIILTATQNTTATNNLGPFMLNRLAATNNSSTNKNLNVAATSSNALNFVKNSGDVLPTLAISNNAATGPLNISAHFAVTDALTVTNSGDKAATISGAIANAAGITFDGAGAGLITLGGGITSGVGGITVNGSYSVRVTGNNTYSGATTVASGTLALGNNNRIADASNLVMSGGTFSTEGFSETLGTLGLFAADSIIDLGSGASVLAFANSSGVTWDSSISLSFVNFDAGVDSIRVGTTGGGLTPTQLGQITINGSAATIGADGYLAISIPEPSTYAAILGLLAVGFAALRRRPART